MNQLKSTQVLNSQYANLAMKLGDLLLNKEKIEQRIAEVKAEIDVLDKALPVAEQVERQLNLEVAQAVPAPEPVENAPEALAVKEVTPLKKRGPKKKEGANE